MKLLNGIFNLFATAATTTTTAVADAADAAVPALTFEPHRFLEMLGYMGKGMLVIFVLIGVIVLVTMLINKIFSREK